ncbi:MAG: mannitol dehydrogenase family protein, partial [Pseudomonadota bacterium]
PGVTAADYIIQTAERFANPAIRDTTRRVAFDGSARHTGFVLPVVRDALAHQAPVEGLALVEALWARMCAGMREDGTEIAPNDPHWAALNAAALAAKSNPLAWLAQRSLYGDIADQAAFATPFKAQLSALWQRGVRPTLAAYLAR